MLNQLPVCGTVLYVAAHPDDENTRLIAWLARHKNVNVHYLSLTRGEGGQNLIGKELGDGLGIIRTYELNAARKVDGGQQWFSRARDFGYSKTPEETYTFWPKDTLVNDVAHFIRLIHPDLIITRFSPEPSPTHGHHTASAQIALAAFKQAGDPSFKTSAPPFQPTRIVWNISSFFFRGREKEFDPTKYAKVDIGNYNPLLGNSYQEIAALSRSQHKSQGFGSGSSRGSSLEYFQFLDGKPFTKDLFEDVDLGPQVIFGKTAYQSIYTAQKEFNASNPAAIIPHLLQVKQQLSLRNHASYQPLLQVKENLLDELINACLGLHAEATTSPSTGHKGDFTVELIVRNPLPAGISATVGKDSLGINQPLINKNERPQLVAPLTSSWLQGNASKGLYAQLPGLDAIIPPISYNAAIIKTITLNHQGKNTTLTLNIPCQTKEVDPVKGEIYQPWHPTQPIVAQFDQAVYLLPKGAKRKITFRTESAEPITNLQWQGSPGLKINTIKTDQSGSGNPQRPITTLYTAEVSGTASTPSSLSAVANGTAAKEEHKITYDHIPHITWHSTATTKIVPIDLKTTKTLPVGYLMGAGDEVPAALVEMGYRIINLTEDDMYPIRLKSLKAIVIGVRALNTHDWINKHKSLLTQYMQDGGHLIVQYHTVGWYGNGSILDSIAPYPLSLGRDRVTMEDARIVITENHPFVNTPNKLSNSDFDGWVQERGLYFAAKWDDKYVAPFLMADDGENNLNGALVTAPVGKGHFTYTGLSFFRQLPAGVPGAYRLMANLIELK